MSPEQRKAAFEAHKAALEAAKQKHGGSLMLACDMCKCGMGTGSYKTPLCQALTR